MGKMRVSHGMKQLLADDPCSPLIHAIEQVQEQAHHRRLGRVLKHLRRRKYELGWVHASEATNPCERVLAAQLLGFEMPRKPPDPKLSRIFENGHMMHIRYSNYFMSLPAPFEVFISPLLRMWPIVGEADIIIYHPEMGWWVIELKSINDHSFKGLREPQLGHIAQVNTYMGLFPAWNPTAELAGGQVWYENKNTQDIKAYALEHQGEDFSHIYDRVLDVTERVIAGELPDACGECEYDDFVADLKGVEERMVKLAATRPHND